MVLVRFYFVRFVLLFLVCCSTVLRGQQKNSDSSFYREDQFYLGMSMVFLTSSTPEFEPSGLSRHFQWGVIRDFPLSAKGTWAAGVGAGMGFDRYTTNLKRTEEKGLSTYTFQQNDQKNSFFITQSALELPVTLRWRNSTASDYAFWRVYGGVSLQWFYLVKGKYEENKVNLKNDFETFGATAHMSIGYNTWNFYVGYSLTPLFSEAAQANSSVPLDMVPLTIGLIFYIL